MLKVLVSVISCKCICIIVSVPLYLTAVTYYTTTTILTKNHRYIHSTQALSYSACDYCRK